jgi:hypothetical protein
MSEAERKNFRRFDPFGSGKTRCEGDITEDDLCDFKNAHATPGLRRNDRKIGNGSGGQPSRTSGEFVVEKKIRQGERKKAKKAAEAAANETAKEKTAIVAAEETAKDSS